MDAHPGQRRPADTRRNAHSAGTPAHGHAALPKGADASRRLLGALAWCAAGEIACAAAYFVRPAAITPPADAVADACAARSSGEQRREFESGPVPRFLGRADECSVHQLKLKGEGNAASTSRN
jgi:hypothetical protein